MYDLIEITCSDSEGYTQDLFKTDNSLTWKGIAETITEMAPAHLKPMYGFTASNRLFLVTDSVDVKDLQFIIYRAVVDVFNCKPTITTDRYHYASDCIEELVACSQIYWLMYGQVTEQFAITEPDGNSFTGVGFTLGLPVQSVVWNGDSPFPAISVLSQSVFDYEEDPSEGIL